jgi:hypothetical protein
MGIKFRCHACDKKLHVKSFLAGKRGVCPKCGAKVRIPLASEESPDAALAGGEVDRAAAHVASTRHAPSAEDNSPAGTSQETVLSGSVARTSAGSGVRSASARDPITEAPDAVWYVRPPTGGQFGPADGTIMRRWLNEGRVSADALVWREGWPDWKSAGPIFPSLEGPEVLAPAATAAAAAVQDVDDAFTFEQPRPAMGRNSARPHSKPARRNVTIIGALVVLCIVLGVALVMVLRMRG